VWGREHFVDGSEDGGGEVSEKAFVGSLCEGTEIVDVDFEEV